MSADVDQLPGRAQSDGDTGAALGYAVGAGLAVILVPGGPIVALVVSAGGGLLGALAGSAAEGGIRGLFRRRGSKKLPPAVPQTIELQAVTLEAGPRDLTQPVEVPIEHFVQPTSVPKTTSGFPFMAQGTVERIVETRDHIGVIVEGPHGEMVCPLNEDQALKLGNRLRGTVQRRRRGRIQ